MAATVAGLFDQSVVTTVAKKLFGYIDGEQLLRGRIRLT